MKDGDDRVVETQVAEGRRAKRLGEEVVGVDEGVVAGVEIGKLLAADGVEQRRVGERHGGRACGHLPRPEEIDAVDLAGALAGERLHGGRCQDDGGAVAGDGLGARNPAGEKPLPEDACIVQRHGGGVEGDLAGWEIDALARVEADGEAQGGAVIRADEPWGRRLRAGEGGIEGVGASRTGGDLAMVGGADPGSAGADDDLADIRLLARPGGAGEGACGCVGRIVPQPLPIRDYTLRMHGQTVRVRLPPVPGGVDPSGRHPLAGWIEHLEGGGRLGRDDGPTGRLLAAGGEDGG